VDLADSAQKQIQTLSKGMQQKLQLCIAMIGEPRILILDEPFSGLDPVNVQLLEEILDERRRAGTTVLLSTHQMNKVEELCDRALMIHHGLMVLHGEVAELRRRYAEHAVTVRTTASVRQVAGVKSIERLDGDLKLTLEAEATPRGVLRALLEQNVEMEAFALATLPLEELFIKVVREGLGLDHGHSADAEPAAAGGGRR